MKTRVVAKFDLRLGIDLYYVQRFCGFDVIGADGKEYAISDPTPRFREVDVFDNLTMAADYARRVALSEEEPPPERIVAEFDGDSAKSSNVQPAPIRDRWGECTQCGSVHIPYCPGGDPKSESPEQLVKKQAADVLERIQAAKITELEAKLNELNKLRERSALVCWNSAGAMGRIRRG